MITGGTGLPGGLGRFLGSGTVSGFGAAGGTPGGGLGPGGAPIGGYGHGGAPIGGYGPGGAPLGGYGPRGVPAGGYGPGSGGMLTNIILHKCSLGILFVSIFILCI